MWESSPHRDDCLCLDAKIASHYTTEDLCLLRGLNIISLCWHDYLFQKLKFKALKFQNFNFCPRTFKSSYGRLLMLVIFFCFSCFKTVFNYSLLKYLSWNFACESFNMWTALKMFCHVLPFQWYFDFYIV